MGGGRTQAYRNECWLCGVKTHWDPALICGGKSKGKIGILEFRPIDVPEESLPLSLLLGTSSLQRERFSRRHPKGYPGEPLGTLWEPHWLPWICAFHAPNPEFSVPA